jgi:hypothetical protein
MGTIVFKYRSGQFHYFAKIFPYDIYYASILKRLQITENSAIQRLNKDKRNQTAGHFIIMI